MSRNRHHIELELIQEANDHLAALAWVREANRIGVGRWFGGQFGLKDYFDAQERGEGVHEFLQRMMGENYDPTCHKCMSIDCGGEWALPKKYHSAQIIGGLPNK